jgi:pyruvate/2-oxoglutarate/acetoin dehydrogenase E1 component
MLQNVPGLRVLAPATPATVDCAFHAALTGDDPTVIVDHVRLADYEGPVAAPPADPSVPRLLRDGGDALVVSYSLMAQESLGAAALLAAEGIEAGVLEVAQLAPLPVAALLAATAGHDALVFADESRAAGSPASHMLARIVAARPGARAGLLCTLDAPSPFAPELVDVLVPDARAIANAVRALLGR